MCHNMDSGATFLLTQQKRVTLELDIFSLTLTFDWTVREIANTSSKIMLFVNVKGSVSTASRYEVVVKMWLGRCYLGLACRGVFVVCLRDEARPLPLSRLQGLSRGWSHHCFMEGDRDQQQMQQTTSRHVFRLWLRIMESIWLGRHEYLTGLKKLIQGSYCRFYT